MFSQADWRERNALWFDRDSFVRSCEPTARSFMEQLVQTQMFAGFEQVKHVKLRLGLTLTVTPKCV